MLRRMTTQKKIVYETLDSLGHASVEEIIDNIRMQHQQISLATIYRNIQTLIEENKIKKTYNSGRNCRGYGDDFLYRLYRKKRK